MDRDYAAEMRALIDTETSHGPYISRAIAREIVEKLKANDLDLLQGWLAVHAEQLIWGAINQRDRSRRSAARTWSPREDFGKAAGEHEAGDTAALGRWLSCSYVVGNGERVPLANLTKADLIYVAADYHERAARNSFEEIFLTALAKKVNAGTVSDHFTEEQIVALRRSLS